MAVSEVNQWLPVVGDAKLIDFDRGGNGAAAPWDYKLLSGCVVTGIGTPTVSVANGQPKAGGILTAFGADTYATPRKNETDYLYWEVTLTKNSAGFVIGYTSKFSLNDLDAPSATASFAFKVAAITIGAANISAIDIGTNDTWYARPTIKILPSDFTSGGAGADTAVMGIDLGAPALFFVEAAGAGIEIWATKTIPPGMKVTLLDIFDDGSNLALTGFEGFYDGVTAMVNLGAGNCNTQVDITDTASKGNNFLGVQVSNVGGADVYGGHATLEIIAV